MTRKNQVIIVTTTDTPQRQLVSRIKTDDNGATTGKWNGHKVVFVENNIWQVAE